MKIYSVIVIALGIALGACSKAPSITGGASGSGGTPAFSDPRLTIQGPDIVGTWKSNCANKGYSESRRFEITYTANSVVKNVLLYTDSACSQLGKKQTSSGSYRFIDKLKNDIYVVEYAFDLGNGITAKGMENVRLSQGKLYIGDNASGEGMGVLEEEPLMPAGLASAQIAGSYSEAKYAVCNAQGGIYLLDFQGTSLTTNNVGRMKLGTQKCNGSSTRWFDGDTAVQVAMSGSIPRLNFPQIGFGEDGIAPSSSNLTSYSIGIIEGNSGPCYFLSTLGSIQELAQICD